MDKFITGNVWQEVNDLIYNNKKQKMAAISYVTSTLLNLDKGDQLICDASINAIKTGQTSINALEYYFLNGIEIFSVEDLHSKFIVSEDFLVIGSANLSDNSALHLIESAIYTENSELIDKTGSFFLRLKKMAESISKSKIDELSNIQIKIADDSKRKDNSKRNELIEDNIPHQTQIIKAEIRKKNDIEYVYLELYKKSIVQFVDKKEIKHIYNFEEIKKWKSFITLNNLPNVYGYHVWVKNLPKHYSNNDKKITTEIMVFVLCDKNGVLIEDPQLIAMDKLHSVYYTIID